MLELTKYLIESKNLHMAHLEDAIFIEGSAGALEALIFVESVLEMLSGHSSKGLGMTVKWDGAPAVFAGTNPENNKFFVGSKSIFNKTPKINYTNADIDKNHAGGLATKLKAALRYLKDIGIKGILQGDILFTKEDLSEITIDGETLLSFTPNTITYAFPSNSDIASEIRKSKLGVVWHTSYSGKKMESLKASFGPNVSYLKKDKNVWSQDAAFKGARNVTFNSKQQTAVLKLITLAKRKLSSLASFLDSIQKNSYLQSELMIYINSEVRGGSLNLSASAFKEHVESKLQKEIEKLKTPKGQKTRQTKKDEIIKEIKSISKKLDKTFSLYGILIQIKSQMLSKLNKVKSVGTFLKTDDGYRVTGHEGFVAIDKVSKKAIKLVDRLEFSKANFTISKNWVTG